MTLLDVLIGVFVNFGLTLIAVLVAFILGFRAGKG